MPQLGFVSVSGMSFMRLLVQSLMLAVMLFHSVMGCCWHHRHECSCGQTGQGAFCSAAQSRVMKTRTARMPQSHSCCGHSHGQRVANQPSPPPVPRDRDDSPHQTRCEHGDCTFLVESSGVCLPDFQTLAHALIDGRSTLRPLVDQSMIAREDFKTEPVTAASRCAVLQVWRI